jgi:ParB family chromosome partitioning protein
MAKGRGLGKGLDSLISSRYTDKTKQSAEEKRTDGLSFSDGVIDGSTPEKASADPSGKNADNKKREEKRSGSQSETKSASGKSAAGNNQVSEVQTGQKAGTDSQSEGQPGVLMMRLSAIEPNRNQPRKDFDEDALNELAESARKHGILQPILVRKSGKRYEIIAGERRWRAAKLAKLKEIPVIIKEFEDGEATEIALIENIQREDLNPVEEAQAYQKLMDSFFLTQEQVAERVGKSRAAVANRVSLLKLDPEVLGYLLDGKLTEGHARALLGLEIKQMQVEAAKEVIGRNLTVRDTEKLVKRYLKPGKPQKKEEFSEADILAYEKLEEELRYSTGTKVEIHRSNHNRGKLILDYYSMEELERLADMFRRFKEV